VRAGPPAGSSASPEASDKAVTELAGALSTERSARSPAYYRTGGRLGLQAAGAPAYAHDQGGGHRGIKPAHLLGGPRGRLVVTGFGLGQVQSDGGLTLSGDLVGTLRYMSPEQAAGHPGQVDQRTDLYALGATLYELVTLEPAFPGQERQELLRQLASEEPRP